MTVPWLKPHFPVDDALMGALRAKLESGQVSNGGPAVRELERRSGEWLGSPPVLAVGSGSMALLLAAAALGGGGRAVLPSHTYIATASALVHAGCELVFCDVDPHTWTLDPVDLRRILDQTDDVRIVAPVNCYGVPPDLRAIAALARGAGAAVLYDDAHGFGTAVDGRRHPDVDVRCISLHATKILPAVEGGLIIAGDPELRRRIQRLRDHGLDADRLQSGPGWNGRIDELRALIGLAGLERFDHTLQQRRGTAARLRAAVPAPLRNQRVPDGVESCCTNFVVQLPPELELQRAQVVLRDQGVASSRYFWPPLHRMEGFTGTRPLPVTEHLERSLLSLPLHAPMAPEHVEAVERGLAALGRA